MTETVNKAKEKNVENEFKELKNEEQELQTYLTKLRALNAYQGINYKGESK